MRLLILLVLPLISIYCNNTLTNKVINPENLNDTATYDFKVKLTKAKPVPANCGYMAFALEQKFEVISTNYPNYNNKYVLIIEPCPEFLGAGFFESSKVYNIKACLNNKRVLGYSYVDYYKENIPKFWSMDIDKVK